MIKIKVIFIFFIFCFSFYVSSQESKPVISVLDFETKDLAESEMKGIISRLSSALFQTGDFNVIDISQREAILNELEFSLSGCADDSCMLEVGKMLSAEAIVVGTISHIGSSFLLSAKLLETESGIILNTADGTYGNIDDLLLDLPIIAVHLAGRGQNDFILVDNSAGSTDNRNVTRGWLSAASGTIFLAGGITLAMLGNSLLQDYSDAQIAYDNAAAGDDFNSLRVSRDEAYSAATDGNADLMFYSGLGIGGVGAVLAGFSIYFFLSSSGRDGSSGSAGMNELNFSDSAGISINPLINGISFQGTYSF